VKLYVFTHMQTTGIHAGIQALHAACEMQRKYEVKVANGDAKAANKKLILDTWADKHKTVWIKNGGNHDALNTLYRRLTHYSAELGLPIGRFDESSMNGCTTAVCIVVPDDIANLAFNNDVRFVGGLREELSHILASYRKFAN